MFSVSASQLFNQMNLRTPPFLTIAILLALTLTALSLTLVRHEWFYRFEVAEGVKIVQAPHKYSYDFHTSKGLVIEDVRGWVIRTGHIYGCSGRISFFLIDSRDLNVRRFNSMTEINVALRTLDLPLYDMNDEENISHLKYDGGRSRKYR